MLENTDSDKQQLLTVKKVQWKVHKYFLKLEKTVVEW